MKVETMETDQSSFDWIPQTLSDTRVAIWGIGLMGGSLALALQGKTSALFGIDPDEKVCHEAESMGIFSRVSTDPSALLPLADLIILCAPLGILPDLIKALPDLHPGSAVVMDIGSTKENILREMESLPDRFAPIGGHPMCGKEVRTLSEASHDLYQGASFALLPMERTPQAAIQLASQLVLAAGSRAILMDPVLHDKWVASISHLPFLVSNCLSAVTPLEASPLVGPGFKSTSRLAVESIDMMIATLINNRENVLASLKIFRSRLELVEDDLENGDFDALRLLFKEGAEQQTAIMDSFQKGAGA